MLILYMIWFRNLSKRVLPIAPRRFSLIEVTYVDGIRIHFVFCSRKRAIVSSIGDAVELKGIRNSTLKPLRRRVLTEFLQSLWPQLNLEELGICKNLSSRLGLFWLRVFRAYKSPSPRVRSLRGYIRSLFPRAFLSPPART